MRHLLAAVLITVSFLSAVSAASAETAFQEYNPDVDKYAFAKSYIQALSYYGRLDKRLSSETALADAFEDTAVVKVLMNNRTLDNTELRIARNYLTKYARSRNMLICKTAYDAALALEKHLLISSRERQLWEAYFRFRTTGMPRSLNENDLKKQFERLARDRKSAGLAVLESVLLFKKVLLSARDCTDETCHQLALTQAERHKLVKQLDVFAADNMAWGVKPGQGTFEASVASVREILEDSAYMSRK